MEFPSIEYFHTNNVSHGYVGKLIWREIETIL